MKAKDLIEILKQYPEAELVCYDHSPVYDEYCIGVFSKVEYKGTEIPEDPERPDGEKYCNEGGLLFIS